MPALEQHRDNPAFVQSVRRKSSKQRIIAPKGPPRQKPTFDGNRRTSLTIAPPIDALPDAGVTEVTNSMAAMLSQGDPSAVDNAEELRSQLRAPPADMTTASSQQRRMEIAEERARAPQPLPIPVTSTNIPQNGPFYEDSMSTDDESTDSETLQHESSGQTGFPVLQSDIMQPGGHARDVRTPEVNMPDAEESLFVRANFSRPSQQEGQTMKPPPAPVTLSQCFAADVARIDARRDEQDPDFTDPTVDSPAMAVEGAQAPVIRKSRSPHQRSPPKKRHSSEIRRETPKKPRAHRNDADEDGKTLTTIKGKRFELLKGPTRQERCDFINRCERSWNKSMAEVIPRSLWPRNVKRDNMPIEPRDWPKTLLEQIASLAVFTAQRPDIARLAVQQAIDERRSWYSNQKWLVFVEDAQAALNLALSGRVAVPAMETSRVDSPVLPHVAQRSEPRSVGHNIELPSGQDDSDDEVGIETAEGDLYNCTPRPQRRPAEVVQPTTAGVAEPEPDLSAFAAVEPDAETDSVDIVDLTMDDADEEDIKQPAAQYDAMETTTRSFQAQPKHEGDMTTLDGIMKVTMFAVSSLSAADLLKLGVAARDWERKSQIAADLVDEGREVPEFAEHHVLDVYFHCRDIQGWVRATFDKRKQQRG